MKDGDELILGVHVVVLCADKCAQTEEALSESQCVMHISIVNDSLSLVPESIALL